MRRLISLFVLVLLLVVGFGCSKTAPTVDYTRNTIAIDTTPMATRP